MAPLLLPIGYVFLPYSFGHLAISNNLFSESLLIMVGLYLHFIGRIILKDYRDVKGDKTYGKKTFLLNHGNVAVCVAAGTSLIASSAVLMYTAGKWFGVFVYSYVVLLFLGLGLLVRLSKTTSWSWQKPILASFGRSMTGVTASLILGLLFTIEPVNESLQTLTAFTVVIVYAWSARQAFEHNAPTN
jgi:4-hydroxybenzoate polyprenyltransferase